MNICRTMLFIPGNNPNMMVNAPVLGADTIIFDIEDAVDIDDKDAARILIRNMIRMLDMDDVEVAVRINDVTTPFWKLDIDTVVPARPNLLVIPKIEKPEDLQMVGEYILQIEKRNNLPLNSIKLAPILETALGIENAFAIANTCNKRLKVLMIGGEDLTASLCAIRTKESMEILYARQRVVTAARAVGIDAIDTIYPDIEDLNGLEEDTKFSRQIGYSGRAIISPRHVEIVNGVFTPSEKEIRYANEVLEVIEQGKRAGKGAITLYGKMIDAPIVERARKVIEIASHIRGGK